MTFTPRLAASGSSGMPLGCLVGAVALVLLLGGSGIAFFALRGSKAANALGASSGLAPTAESPLEPAASPTAQPPQRPPRIEGRTKPLVADLNGDGAAEVVVAASVHEESGMTRRFLALDGKNGVELWRTSDLGSDVFSSSAVLEHGRFLIVNRTGKVTAFEGRNGKELWTAALGERVSIVCKAKEPEAVRVKLADDRAILLDTHSGRTTPSTDKSPCERANGSQEERFSRDPADRRDARAPAGVKSVVCGGVRVMGDRNFTVADQCKAQFKLDPDALRGMSASALWQQAGGVLAFGTKSPGTRVPMIAFLKGNKPLWSTEVPDRNPLETREGAPDHIALEGNRLFVAFEPQSGDKPAAVTALDVASGARLWTSTLPGKLRGVDALVAGSPTVFVTAGDNLVGLSAADGKQRFLIGDGD